MSIIVAFGLSLFLNSTPADQFVFNNGVEPESLDPHRVSSNDAALLTMQLFEGLIVRDANYEKLEPAIAESWKVSKNGMVYTFTLRKNLKWSNGDPLTTQQVYDSFVRAMDPEVGCLNIQQYSDNIEGADEYIKNFKSPQKASFLARLGIKVKDNNTIEFKLKKPNVLFLDFLTLPEMMVIHPSMANPRSKSWMVPENFISNAAYKLKSWEVNKKVIFEKNPNYRDADKTKIKELISLPVNDENTVYNLYTSKQIDWTGQNTLASAMVSSLKKNPEFHITTYLGTYTFVLNTKVKPLDDIRVRRALSLAINRKNITDQITRAGQVPTDRYIALGLEGYPYPAIHFPPHEEQVAAAKKLLADAGYPGGKNFPKLTLVYNTDEGHHKIAQAVQQMWKKDLGIDIDLTNKEWKVFIKEQAEKKFDISRLTWLADFPDPTDMLNVYLGTSANNRSNWQDKEFDALVFKSISITDRKKRFQYLADAEKILLNNLPMIPIYHYVGYSMMSSRIKGFKPNMFGKYYFKYLKKD